MILAGDVGGTKCHLALFETGASREEPIASARLPSAEHESFESVLDAFRRDHPGEVSAAAFGIAGPVMRGVVKTTNLPWTIRATAVGELLGTPRVRLLNDLVTTALGLELLREDETEELQAGSGESQGNLAVIAAGTGLGEAGLVRDGDRWVPLSSEGGHADFAPRDEVEVELWRWLREAHPRVEYEMLVSGPGMVNLYRFFHRERPHAPLWGDGEAGPDAAAAISAAAMEGACPACRESLERFVSIYGAEAGNLALKLMAGRGVYVAGGIAPRILPVLRDGRFTDAFNAKGAFSDLMRSLPVRIVLNPETALLGAARAAAEAAAG